MSQSDLKPQDSIPKPNMMNQSNEKVQADKLIIEAKSLLDSKSFLSYLFISESDRKESAIDLYKRAANYYKIAGLKAEAGYALLESCKVSVGFQTSNYYTAMSFKEGADLLKSTDTVTAIRAYEQAIQIFLHGSTNYLRYAAQCQEAIAEMYIQMKQNDLAILMYIQACVYHEAETFTYERAKCYHHIICLSITQQLYDNVITYAEKYADIFEGKPLGNHKTNPILFSAILCHLIMDDMVQTMKKIREYTERYHGFNRSKEYKYLGECIDAFDRGDFDFFLKPPSQFQFDQSQSTLFNVIHEKLKKQEDDLC